MEILALTVAALAALIVVGLAVLGAQRAARGVPVRRVDLGDGARGHHTPCDAACLDPALVRAAERLVGTDLRPGHRLELLHDGDGTFPRLWADLAGARESISLLCYYVHPGRVMERACEILAERARAGIRVRVLVDAVGSRPMGDEAREALRRAGVEIHVARRVRLPALARAQHRLHARVVVVDGLVGYTGGFGLDDKWLGGGRRPGEWRDTNVRVTGPAVLQLQAAFLAHWAEATGHLLADPALFPEPPREGGVHATLVHATPAVGSTTGERFLTLALALARRRLWVTNSYFTPTPVLVRLLVEAAARGVDTRLLVAGERTDVRLSLLAGRARYEALLRGGVRIHEYEPAMLHAKTLVVDGRWGAVGSLTFDNRGMALNDEAMLVVADERFAGELEARFLDDLDRAPEIRLEAFRRRPWHARTRERGAAAISRFL